jgi:hypothetical protein
MKLNCQWREKMKRYSDKVFTRVLKDVGNVNNTYVLGFILQNLRYWKAAESSLGNQIADKLLLDKSLNEFDLFEVWKYGLRSSQPSYLKSIQADWKTVGFIISEAEIKATLDEIKDESSEEMIKLISKALNPDWRSEKFIKSMKNPSISSAEISSNTNLIKIKVHNKQIVFYGLTYEYNSFSELIEIIDSLNVQNVALPLQTFFNELDQAKLQEILEKNLEDISMYKLLEVPNLIVSNVFGVKTTNFPWSLVLRNLDKNVKFYYPNTLQIAGFYSEFTEVEKLVRLTSIVEHCRVLNDVSDQGCYLCTKRRLVPVPFQDQAIYAAPFLDTYLKHIGNALNQFILSSEGNILIVCPKRLLLPIIKNSINSTVVTATPNKLTDENDMLLNIFYNTEK